MEWHIFINDVTPARATVAGDLTFDDDSFPPVSLTSDDFTLEQVLSDVGSIQAPTIPFENVGADTVLVYGYAIVNTAGVLIAAARFNGAPLTIDVADTTPVVPVLSVDSLLPEV
jgi:hypothetical protein